MEPERNVSVQELSPMPADIVSTDHGVRIGDLEVLFGVAVKRQLLRANSLILHGPRPIVVDPAAQEPRHRELAAGNPILYFTHYHADHRAAEHVYPASTEVWASEADAEAIESMESFVNRVDRGSDGEQLRNSIRGLQMMFRIGPRKVSRRVTDGGLLEAGGCTGKVMALPGHTPGHSGIYFPGQSLLFITDIDLTAFGPWYGNDASDITLFKSSLQRVREFKCDYYFTSHGEEVLTRGRFLEKLDAFEAHFDRRDRLLLEALSTGEKSVDELCRLELVYRSKTLAAMEHMIHFERKHVKKHLDLLEAAGKVRPVDESRRRYQLAA